MSLRLSGISIPVLMILLMCCLTGTSVQASPQGMFPPLNSDTVAEYDEINVLVIIEKLGSFYLDILYTPDEKVFVDVIDLFKTLKIACVAGKRGDSIGGFIGQESNRYLIDYPAKSVRSGNLSIAGNGRLIKDLGRIFVEAGLMSEAFGISLIFNPRSLTLMLNARFELPIVKQLRQEKVRANLSKLSGKITADTTVSRTYHLLNGGNIDWSAGVTQNLNGHSDVRLYLGVGGELLYGETDIWIDYYNQQVFTGRQLNYLWKWIDNDHRFIRQAQLGKINLQTITFLNAPLIGGSARNSPTTVRKASGYYTIQEYTEPDWLIELYINDVLVDFTKSDASGMYVFRVPVVYGFTTLKFKFYGPMGEERIEERQVNLPYTVLPEKEFDYGVVAGVLQNSAADRFGKADFNYGIIRNLTIGGGMEFLSSLPENPFMPYARLTFQPFSKLMINLLYVHGVETGGVVNLYLFRNANVELNYHRYVPGQMAIPFKPLEERRGNLSLPLRFRKISGYIKLDYSQMVYPFFRYNQAAASISIYYKKFSLSSNAQFNWLNQTSPYSINDLAMSMRLKRGYTIRFSNQTNLTYGYVMNFKFEAEKRFEKGFVSAYFERNVQYVSNSFNVTFRYDLPFARTGVSVAMNKDDVLVSGNLQGSLALGSGNGHVYKSNITNVGKGGLAVYPFLDRNLNGRMDPGEPMIRLTSLKIMGSKILYSEKDTIIRIPELNPFTTYLVEFNNNDLENIYWKFSNKTYSVLIDPNQFKRLEVAVVAAGEVSGTTSMLKKGEIRGTSRIVVKVFRKEDQQLVATLLSESDGYIYYIGLMPGNYIAMVDQAQLDNLGMTSEPAQREFTIRPSDDGDAAEGLDFLLRER